MIEHHANTQKVLLDCVKLRQYRRDATCLYKQKIFKQLTQNITRKSDERKTYLNKRWASSGQTYNFPSTWRGINKAQNKAQNFKGTVSRELLSLI